MDAAQRVKVMQCEGDAVECRQSGSQIVPERLARTRGAEPTDGRRGRCRHVLGCARAVAHPPRRAGRAAAGRGCARGACACDVGV
jgi:hypothetical protein